MKKSVAGLRRRTTEPLREDVEIWSTFSESRAREVDVEPSPFVHGYRTRLRWRESEADPPDRDAG
jgi:hypothetical protein